MFLNDDEITQEIIASMDETAIKSWQIPSTTLILGHFGIGRFIRNKYKLWDEKNYQNYGRHPEDRSMDIMILIWKRINNGDEYKGYSTTPNIDIKLFS